MRKGILLLFLLFSVRSFATGQIPDKIIYEGTTYSLQCNPLEKYFDQFPEKRPNSTVSSTALWRGYVATFEVYGKKLCLKDIIVDKKVDSTSYRMKKVSVFKEIFGNIERFDCDFYNGLLALPYGNIVAAAQSGFGSTYENYILLEINNGDLTKSKAFDYKGYNDFREKQFAAYKLTDDYKKQYGEMQKMFEETNEIVKATMWMKMKPPKSNGILKSKSIVS
ncbi:MAG TPA: hypothetical protein VK476_00810 [Flavobacterium sp.]|nr:hypothetical protein [Flavobacterium sp.]